MMPWDEVMDMTCEKVTTKLFCMIGAGENPLG